MQSQAGELESCCTTRNSRPGCLPGENHGHEGDLIAVTLIVLGLDEDAFGCCSKSERGFEPTSSLRSQHSSTQGDRIDVSLTSPAAGFGPFFGGRCPSEPYRSGV